MAEGSAQDGGGVWVWLAITWSKVVQQRGPNKCPLLLDTNPGSSNRASHLWELVAGEGHILPHVSGAHSKERSLVCFWHSLSPATPVSCLG